MQRMRTIVVAVAAALALGGVATVAHAAPAAKSPATGVWTGATHQDIPPLADDADFVEWSQRITVRTHGGRLTYLGVSVRYVCPDDTNPLAGDIQISEGWKLGLGPRLTPNGGFALRLLHTKNLLTGKRVRLPMPVSIAGTLGAGGAGGRFDLSGNGGCSGKGSWQAKRTF